VSRGLFITFEGGEGSGKSTQLKRLAEQLKEARYDVLLTREPGGSPGAEAIRSLLVTGAPDRWDGMTEALLFFAARRDHVERTVKPAISDGKIVISDRFADTTMAYQGYGHDLGRDVVERLYTLSIGTFKPDLTLIFDLPVEDGLKRAAARGGEEHRFEDMNISFHQRLRDGFLDIAEREPERCMIIDASANEDEVSAEISRAVLNKVANG